MVRRGHGYQKLGHVRIKRERHMEVQGAEVGQRRKQLFYLEMGKGPIRYTNS